MQYPMVMPKKIRPSLCAAIPHLLTGFVLVKGSSDRSAVRPSKFLSLAFLVFKYQHPRLWTPVVNHTISVIDLQESMYGESCLATTLSSIKAHVTKQHILTDHFLL